MKSEMFWYLIKDGESEDMGTETIFWGVGVGRICKKDGSIFPSDSELLKT